MHANRTESELREFTTITEHGIAVEGREIRSHRAPTERSRTLAFVAIGLAATMLTTGIVASQTTLLTMPTRPAVAYAGELTLRTPLDLGSDSVGAQTPPDDALRATRSIERKPVASRIEIVISYALAQQGKPYRWAQSGPGGFDCSGLVLAAFRQVGVTLPHYTGTIILRGVKVAHSALIRGDVVFPESGHVGIYLGNNKFVHASSSKGSVTVTKLYSFYAARRIAV